MLLFSCQGSCSAPKSHLFFRHVLALDFLIFSGGHDRSSLASSSDQFGFAAAMAEGTRHLRPWVSLVLSRPEPSARNRWSTAGLRLDSRRPSGKGKVSHRGTQMQGRRVYAVFNVPLVQELDGRTPHRMLRISSRFLGPKWKANDTGTEMDRVTETHQI